MRRAVTFQTPVGIMVDRRPCQHHPGPVGGLPCAAPGCARGVDGAEVVVGGVTYRRRLEDRKVDTVGQTSRIERCVVWFALEALDSPG